MTTRLAHEVLGELADEFPPWLKMATAVRRMLKTGVRMEAEHVSSLLQITALYESEVKGFDHFFNHRDMAEARAIATWINSLS